MTDTEIMICNVLEKMGIEYKRYTHDIKNTIEEKEKMDKELGITAKHCKNIFLTDRKKINFYFLVMPFEKGFYTSEVSKELGSSRLSFASEDIMEEKLHCKSGSLSSLLLLYDEECDIGLAVDADLLKYEELCFHPGINTVTLTIKTDDYLNKFLPKIKHRPTFVTVSDKHA